MIRTWIGLVPSDRRGKVIAYALLAMVSVIVRAVGTVLLVPLVGALFSDSPQRALGWLGWLTAATAAGWAITSTVRSRVSRLSACCTRYSDSGSAKAVASSRIRTLVSARIARAIVSRWRSPPERPLAAPSMVL